MAELCREFEISRKTGYKIFNRYNDEGLEGLTDRSRKPFRQARQLPVQDENEILSIKPEHPIWGAPKIRDKLRRCIGDNMPLTAINTVHSALDRNGLVNHTRSRHYKAKGTALSIPTKPSDLWRADYKGKFMLANGYLSTYRHRFR